MKKRVDPCARESRGLTLIELLVVVAILSATTWLAFGSVGEDRRQQRFNDTELRLVALRHAITGVPPAGRSVEGAWRLSGFVVDNGRLPVSVRELVQMPEGWSGQAAAKQPRFDPFFNQATCLGNGNALDYALIKGHRGMYLDGVFNGVYRDGWGNVAQTGDSENFGWQFLTASGETVIRSLGANNAFDASPPALAWDADTQMLVSRHDWSVDPNGWAVTVRFRVAANVSQWKAILLVFRNDASGGHWLHIASEALSAAVDADDSRTLYFSVNTCGEGGSSLNIPSGRHLLVLSDGTGTPRAVTQTVFFAGADRPDAVLEVR